MLLLCYLFNEDVNIFFMTVKSQRLIGAPSRGEPPPHLSLLPLSAGACGLYWGGEHYHGKVCRFKMVGFSGDVRNDWSLSGSFSFLNFVCLVIELSFGENIHEDRATKFQTMQPQVSRTCSFLWIDTYLFFKIHFYYSLLQDIEYGSLCYTVNPCCLSILHMVVCIL